MLERLGLSDTATAGLRLACCLLAAACSSASDAAQDRADGGHAGSSASVADAAASSGQGGNAGAGSSGGAGQSAIDASTHSADAAVDLDAAISGDAAAADDASTTDLPGFTLVWHDEFDGPTGSSPDTSRWVFETGGHGFGNSELEYYTARTDNAALDGQGRLVITAREESYMGRDYTSARLKTHGTFEHTYGRYEARMKLPQGQGIWPAFWMLGVDIGTAGWPSCGEIDVMENIGREPSTVHGTLHGPGYSGGNGIGGGFDLPSGEKFADAFHVFAMEWEAQEIRWYVDGQLYQTRAPSDLPQGADWVYDHSFFLLLNLAVGGLWPGNPDATTTFPQTLTVDYVRVYDAVN